MTWFCTIVTWLVPSRTNIPCFTKLITALAVVSLGILFVSMIVLECLVFGGIFGSVKPEVSAIGVPVD